MEPALQHIFNVRVPGRGKVGLRPEVPDRVRAAQRQRDQMVNFVVPWIPGCDPVPGVSLFLEVRGNSPHLSLSIPACRYPGSSRRIRRRGKLGIWKKRFGLLRESANTPEETKGDGEFHFPSGLL